MRQAQNWALQTPPNIPRVLTDLQAESAQAAITHNIFEASVPVQAAPSICFPAAIPCFQGALFPSSISP